MNEDAANRRRAMHLRIERAKIGMIRAAVSVVGAARLHAEHDEYLTLALQEWERTWDAYVMNGIEMAAFAGDWPRDDPE
jgi:hypothetical protein